MPLQALSFLALLGSATPVPDPAPIPPWGFYGHEIAARAAAATLPRDMPEFFRAAADQLAFLNPEPDRWRVRESVEMDQAFAYDHYIDLENVPEHALDASDRFTYLKALYESGLEKPERDAGFLPFRIVELHQRLVSAWERWRDASDPRERAWIEQRIVNDAGVLGHYVMDASQPHHTTIHFNGWAAGAANPDGYTDDRTFHARFERHFVEAHVTARDVVTRVRGTPEALSDVRAAVLDYVRASHGEVEALYRLDRDVGFNPDGPRRQATRDFAADRLAAGASMLATLWWSAWQESGRSGA